MTTVVDLRPFMGFLTFLSTTHNIPEGHLSIECLNAALQRTTSIDIRNVSQGILNLIGQDISAALGGRTDNIPFERREHWADLHEFIEEFNRPDDPTASPRTTMDRIHDQMAQFTAMGLPPFSGHLYGDLGTEGGEGFRQLYESKRIAHEEMPLIGPQCDVLIETIKLEERKHLPVMLEEVSFSVLDGLLYIHVAPKLDNDGEPLLDDDGEPERPRRLSYRMEIHGLRGLSIASCSERGITILPPWSYTKTMTVQQIANHMNLRIQETLLPRLIQVCTRLGADGVRSVYTIAGPRYVCYEADQLAAALKAEYAEERGVLTYQAETATTEFRVSIMKADAPVLGEVFSIEARGRMRDRYAETGSSPKFTIGYTRYSCFNGMTDDIIAFNKGRRRVGRVTAVIPEDLAEQHRQLLDGFDAFTRTWEQFATTPLVQRDVVDDMGEVTQTVGVFSADDIAAHQASVAERRRKPEDLTTLESAIDLALLKVGESGIANKHGAGLAAISRDTVVALMLLEVASLEDATVADVVNAVTRHHDADELEKVLIPVRGGEAVPAKAIDIVTMHAIEGAAIPLGRQLCGLNS